ncbi:MAG: DUF480 domain-containing protein [Thermoleophilaceae bacterium]|nr:DUF480 domain-containing protein [Thermoleophilaceae bacterium]
MDLGPVEIRVLGCLVEKQRTTPDAYPLSLNALRLACNQATNREPVLDLEEGDIRHSLERTTTRRLTRLASRGRTVKYRHLLPETIGVEGPALAVLAALMLRGPQTAGELNARSERMSPGLDVSDALRTLEEKGLAAVEPRQAGQKGVRYVQTLADEAGVQEPGRRASERAAPEQEAPPPRPDLEQRVEALERAVAELRARLSA